jgi:hypothetical protein
MQDAASEAVHDVRQFPRQIAKLAGSRNDRIALLVQLLQGLVPRLLRRRGRALALAEQTGEGAVNRVRGAIRVRVNREADVLTFRPNLPSLGVHRVSLGFEITDFGECQLEEAFIARSSHRDVAPGRAAEGSLPATRGDDLLTQHRPTPEIGPQETAPRPRQWLAAGGEQPEANAVADETQEAFAGCGSHFQSRCGHLFNSSFN